MCDCTKRDVGTRQELNDFDRQVNISPSLHSSSPLDLAVKAPLVQDLMNIVGFHIPCSKKFTEVRNVRIHRKSRGFFCFLNDNNFCTVVGRTVRRFGTGAEQVSVLRCSPVYELGIDN